MPATEVADDFAEELDQTVRRSSRLAGRPVVPPVVLAISSEDGSERLSHTTLLPHSGKMDPSSSIMLNCLPDGSQT
ncbi:hypothetical protein P3342_002806 [Pyrenophora teres f. teres]|nr:hypothetical protein P3342_002806 [Pyrenophora teres f. teres]